ncbi:MAG: ABC-2 transporter permease [Lachnospiraceae bacterium]|jgi:ABC-2 type transport system permease protein|nr:ABC-2 transporter permease [Lachnospiraceae bacterium]
MLFSLVKKDFLIVKKYVGIMFIVSFLIPPVMLWRTPEAGGAMGFTLAVIFSIFMLAQYVSLKEYQYPKATTLLCALPYPRKMIVLSKYCFCLVIYAACCLVFGIDTLIFPELGIFDIRMAAIIFSIITIVISFYFPALYKLGYEKTKFVFVMIIMASPVLFAFLFKPEIAVRFGFLDTIPTTVMILLSVIISLAVFSISAFLSIRFFEKSDLS